MNRPDPWKVLAGRVAGETWEEIGDRYGCSAQTCRRSIRAVGVHNTWARGAVLLQDIVETIGNARVAKTWEGIMAAVDASEAVTV